MKKPNTKFEQAEVLKKLNAREVSPFQKHIDRKTDSKFDTRSQSMMQIREYKTQPRQKISKSNFPKAQPESQTKTPFKINKMRLANNLTTQNETQKQDIFQRNSLKHGLELLAKNSDCNSAFDLDGNSLQKQSPNRKETLYDAKLRRIQQSEQERKLRQKILHEKSMGAKKALDKQQLHSCSNADSCELDTQICSASKGKGVSQMSNFIKFNNLILIQELAELDRADKLKSED